MSEIPLPPAKPVWIRHPGCQQLVFNEPLNINAHKQACPYDIKMTAQKLEERVAELEGLIKHLVEAPAEAPAPALDSIGSWDEAAAEEDQTEAWDEDSTKDVPGGEPFVQQQPERDEWDDDENSLASTPAGPIPIR